MARSRTTFKKGQVNNPKGRPKEVAHVRALAREKTEAAIETLVQIMQNESESASARVAAARELLDRGYGKAPAHMTHEVDKTVTVLDLTDSQLMAIASGETTHTAAH